MNAKDFYKQGALGFAMAVVPGHIPAERTGATSWQAKACDQGFNEARYQYVQLIASYAHDKARADAYWVVTGEALYISKEPETAADSKLIALVNQVVASSEAVCRDLEYGVDSRRKHVCRAIRQNAQISALLAKSSEDERHQIDIIVESFATGRKFGEKQ